MELPFLVSGRDKRAFGRLKKAIATRNVIPFVGAGLSMRAGFSNWDDLLDKIAGRRSTLAAERQATDIADLSWRAENVRNRVSPSRYHRFLKEHFGRTPKTDEGIAAFARLGFRHIFTTNYDRSLEVALKRNGYPDVTPFNWQLPNVPSQVLRTFGTTDGAEKYVVYLHGRYDTPRRIVLSESDYRDTYVRSDETVRKLFAIFSMRRVAFFGFSLRDLDVLSIFRQVRAANAHAEHFAVLPDPTSGFREREWSRARFISKFGIHPIYYLPGGGDHPNLVDLLWTLGSRTTSYRRRRSMIDGAGTYATSRDFREKRGVADPEDPQKGRFGGKASDEGTGRALTAEVHRSRQSKDWFDIEVRVSRIGGRPLKGKVDLWVHDSFPQEHYWTFAKNNSAKFTFSAYGAFTVGATCDRGRTALELDLADVKGAPRDFRLA